MSAAITAQHDPRARGVLDPRMWYSATALIRTLRIGRKTLVDLQRDGLPSSKLGKERWFRGRDIAAVLERRLAAAGGRRRPVRKGGDE